MSVQSVLTALDSLSAALAGMGGGGGSVRMLPITLPTPTGKLRSRRMLDWISGSSMTAAASAPGPTGQVELKFVFTELMNPRDLMAIAGTVTLRVAKTGTQTATKDLVYMISELGVVSPDGLTVVLPLTKVDLFDRDPADAYDLTVSVVAWDPISGVRYVGV